MKKFYLAAAALILLIFWANSAHMNQLGVFYNYVLPQAMEIHYGDFTFTYPMWGYSILAAIGVALGEPIIFLQIIQYLLAVFGVKLLYDISRAKPKFKHLPLLIPWAAMMSVKWPQSISSFLILLIIWIYQNNTGGKSKRWGYTAIAVAFGLALNFRSEYLYLPVVAVAIVGLVALIRKRRREFVASGQTCLAMAAGIILLIPWAINSWIIYGKPLLNSSNGGMVSYISLGDLPRNKWGIDPIDETAWRRAHEAGEKTPFTRRADSILTAEFKKRAFDSPIDYAQKCGYNVFRSVFGGLYIGEYAYMFTPREKMQELTTRIGAAKTLEDKIWELLGGGSSAVLLIFEKLLRLASMVVFAIILFKAYLRSEHYSGARLLALAIILYQILLCAALLYEPRMMNAVYMPALALALHRRKLKANTPNPFHRGAIVI